MWRGLQSGIARETKKDYNTLLPLFQTLNEIMEVLPHEEGEQRA